MSRLHLRLRALRGLFILAAKFPGLPIDYKRIASLLAYEIKAVIGGYINTDKEKTDAS